MAPVRRTRDLETRLGYRFKKQALLDLALTHSSVNATRSVVAREDNERLEFLGDRVLGLAVSHMLVLAFPEAPEGVLAQRYNRLVRGETCAEVARAMGLGAFLRLSDSEADNGGRNKETILADACEALLGAIFLEAGFDKARAIIERHWQPWLQALPVETADAKSALQEWAQGRGLALPSYTEIQREGPDHAPHFTAEVRIKGVNPARGTGSSKRIAEQAAATALLEREGVRKGRTT